MNIHIENLSKNFGATQVLRNIGLEIPDREFVSLLGPSGCGKTTLLRILAGFEDPSEGQVLFDGKPVSSPGHSVPPEKRNISMVFQSFALWPHLTVREHLEFPLRHHRFVAEEIRGNSKRHIEETLEIVGLSRLAGRYPAQLSGGQRQRVALARAMVTRPAVMLMDEPLSALDAGLRIAMREEIQRIHRICGCTVLYVTHDQSEALAMSDRVLIMNNGIIEQNGNSADIYYRPATPFVARFVSGSNLLAGEWHGEAFCFGSQDRYRWIVPDVQDAIKREGLCPLRPDQLVFTSDPGELPGVIQNVQFQGRENHYTIGTALGALRMHIPGADRCEVGRQVFLALRDKAESAGAPADSAIPCAQVSLSI
ncbi:MAG: ABC transporter ATP-binding protein [Spirochaetales bacterium]|jgi:iron(III) transport system ATP-binding protein|nr:ABC transporter ATP-binding protein [Spirochaetales bacterium]